MDIDFESASFLENPHKSYDALRAAHPIFFSERNDMWLFSSYEAVKAVLNDDINFVYHKRIGTDHILPNSSSNRLFKYWFLYQSEEKQKVFRKIVGPYFSGKIIADIESYIVKEVDSILGDFKERSIDLVESYGTLLPIKVMMRILGISDVDVNFIKKVGGLMEHFMHFPSNDKDQKIFDFATQNLEQFIFNRIEKKDYDQDGIISYLLGKAEEGIITREEAIYNVMFFVMAAAQTTVHSLCNALMLLVVNKDQRKLFIENSESADKYVEELMRYESTVSYARRFAAHDIEVFGQQVKKGDRMLLLLNAANRDPLVFSNPHQLDLDRLPVKNLAFGYGGHFCLGAHLAKMEIRVALTYFFEKYPNCDLVDQQIHWNDRFGFRVIKNFKVKLN